MYRPPSNPDGKIQLKDSASIDAFSRLRVSNPQTIFDTKLNHTNEPEFWDDQEVSGGSTTSTHNADRASVVMGVALNTAGKRVRQTFARPNYQPGKSQMIQMTGIIGAGNGGITQQLGVFDDENGLFFSYESGTMSVVKRSFVTGSAVDTSVAQSAWNLDKMDGTGPSGITIDWTKTQIFIIDFQWLGVGRVRFSLDVDGLIFPIHEMLHANSLDAVYMSTPNNPLRYSIENDGTGAATTMECICSSVLSEGGQESTGVDYWVSTEGVHVDANVADTVYAVVGVRLKTGHKGEPAGIERVGLLTETNDNYEWIVLKNPTVAGTFTYADEYDIPFQSARGVTANTVTGGVRISGDFASKGTATSAAIDDEGGFGEAIDGTRDEFVLCVRPLGSNADIQGGVLLHVNH